MRLLVSAWADDCGSNAMHLVKLPPALDELAATARRLATWRRRARWRSSCARGPRDRALPHPRSVAVQKNPPPSLCTRAACSSSIRSSRTSCSPSTRRRARARRSPRAAAPSHPALAAVQARWGRVSGGAPPLLLARHGVYLGLAHAKRERGEFAADVGTRRMVYRHLFYAFAARPPFEVVAAGAPFALPQPAGGRRPPTVQFAAGLALDEAAAELLVTYGVLDCGMHATRVALGRVLEDLGIDRLPPRGERFSRFLPLHGQDLALSSCWSIVGHHNCHDDGHRNHDDGHRNALARVLAILPALTLVGALELPHGRRCATAPALRDRRGEASGSFRRLKLDEIRPNRACR